MPREKENYRRLDIYSYVITRQCHPYHEYWKLIYEALNMPAPDRMRDFYDSGTKHRIYSDDFIKKYYIDEQMNEEAYKTQMNGLKNCRPLQTFLSIYGTGGAFAASIFTGWSAMGAIIGAAMTLVALTGGFPLAAGLAVFSVSLAILLACDYNLGCRKEQYLTDTQQNTDVHLSVVHSVVDFAGRASAYMGSMFCCSQQATSSSEAPTPP